MKRLTTGFLATLLVLSQYVSAFACDWCRANVKSGIYDANFVGIVSKMLLPIILLTGVGLAIYRADKISDKLKGRMK